MTYEDTDCFFALKSLRMQNVRTAKNMAHTIYPVIPQTEQGSRN